MSVRKREWITQKGEAREAWVVDYTDGAGKRHNETFARKKDADARESQVKVDVRAGTHTVTSRSMTVAEAAQLWIEYVESQRARANHDRDVPPACPHPHCPTHGANEAGDTDTPGNGIYPGPAHKQTIAANGAKGAAQHKKHHT